MPEPTEKSVLSSEFFKEKQRLLEESTDPETLKKIVNTKPIDLKNDMKRALEEVRELHKTKRFLIACHHLEPLFAAFERFSGLIDSVVPLIPFSAGTAIWGIMKFSFNLVESRAELYDQLFEDLEDFDKELGLASDISESKSLPEAVRQAIRDVYSVILDYWLYVPRFYKQQKFLGLPLDTYQIEYKTTLGPLKEKVQNRCQFLYRVVVVRMIPESPQGNGTRNDQWDEFEKDLHQLVPTYSETLEEKNCLRMPETCLWIETESEYLEWKKGAKFFFWLSGGPGVGKTILATRLIKEAQAQRRGVVYYLCEHDQADKLTHDDICRSLCFQLFLHLSERSERSGEVPAANLLFLWKKYQGKSLCGPDTTALCFQELLDEISTEKITIYIDGLDEVPDAVITQLLRWLWRLSHLGSSQLQVFLSSRPTLKISDLLERNKSHASNCSRIDIQLERVQELVQGDIRRLVSKKLTLGSRSMSPSTQELKEWEEQRIFVLKNLPQMSQGQFQWAELMIQEVNDSCTTKDVALCLREDNTRISLPAIYAKIIRRLQDTLQTSHWRRAEYLLRWLACGLRPLRLEEIIELFDLQESNKWNLEDAEKLDDEGDLREWNPGQGQNETERTKAENLVCKRYEDQIRQSCGCLVQFRSSKDGQPRHATLHFVHLSVKEFLLRSQTSSAQSKSTDVKTALHINPAVVHAKLFWDCMAYLSNVEFDQPLMQIRGNAFKASDLARRPFFRYAALSWHQHLCKSGDIATIEKSRVHLQRFFQMSQVRTWMEGVIALEDGIEWLHRSSNAVDKWLQEHAVPSIDVSAFYDWANDIAAEPFKEYEAVLLHNTSEVHYLDSRVLFPTSMKHPNFQPSFFRLQESLKDLDPKSELFRERMVDTTPLGRQASFPVALFFGESGDNDYGFIVQDRNALKREHGIFLIDRKVNHPRLVWEPLSDRSGHGIPLKANSKRSDAASVHRADKLGGHNLWTTMSATLRDDGTALAAVFSERPPLERCSMHLKVILWQFQATEQDQPKLERWLKNFHGLEAASNTKHVRPTIPSTGAVDQGGWATTSELHLTKEIIVDQDGIFSDSRGLVAFHGSNYLLTPAGVYDYLKLEIIRDPWEEIKQFITVEATIIPEGRKIVGFTDDSRNALAIVTLLDGEQYGRISSTSIKLASILFEKNSKCEHIIACSDDGNYVGLTMRTEAGGLIVGVLELDSEDYTVVYRIPAAVEANITHCVFDVDREQGRSTGSHKQLRYIGLIVEAKYLVNVYSLLVFSFENFCLALQTDVPGKPEGLLFLRDPNETSLVLLNEGRRVTQHPLYMCEQAQSLEERSRMNQVLKHTAMNTDLTPTVDGKGLQFTLAKLESTLQRPDNRYVTIVTLESWNWSRQPHDITAWSQTSKSSITLPLMTQESEELSQHGIISSPNLVALGFWVGSSLRFFSRSGDSILLLENGTDPIKGHHVCINVQFSSSALLAASLWRRTSSSGANDGCWQVRIHSLTSKTVSVLGTFSLESEPKSIAFHPSIDIFAVSMVGELQIFQISADLSVCLIKKVCSEYLRTTLQVHEKPNGPASPPSTENNTAEINVEEDFEFQYSCCTKFLFNQSWNRFISAQVVAPEPEVTRPFIYQLAEQTGVTWASISADRPAIMEEDHLYAAGQQRFKIFKIRTYLVLGWSADGTNLWWDINPLDTGHNSAPTWYRRVICAIPLSLSKWRAKLTWPRSKSERLTVFLYPSETLTNLRLPVCITSPLSSGDMVPTDKGWLKGHAAGCPYHLGIIAKG